MRAVFQHPLSDPGVIGPEAHRETVYPLPDGFTVIDDLPGHQFLLTYLLTCVESTSRFSGKQQTLPMHEVLVKRVVARKPISLDMRQVPAVVKVTRPTVSLGRNPSESNDNTL
jgi:hypothetical protein